MNLKMLKAALVGLILSVSGFANAGVMTYAGSESNTGNCIPFGCPDSYGDHLGFVYKNIDAFTLNVGDIIAFDMGGINDFELSFDLSLASTTSNGNDVADGDGFTFISSLGSGFFGDNVIGNYDLVFIAQHTFSFDGGGLIFNFENTNGAVNDTSWNPGLVYSSDNPYTVRRYFHGNSVGDMSNSSFSDGQTTVGHWQLRTAEVPEPTTLAIFALGIIGLASRRFKKR